VNTALKQFELFGLLHVARDAKLPINMKVRGADESLGIYLANAVTLAKSLEQQGVRFTLLTNDLPAINALYERRPFLTRIPVRELAFSRAVPEGIGFFSAHYKLDVFQFLSTLEGSSYVGLLDLDMIAVNELPASLRSIIEQRIPACYDITEQVLSGVGRGTLIGDLSRFTQVSPEGRWIGGECIMGPPAFFAKLSTRVDALFAQYASCFDQLHHQGDEMLVSAALEDLRREGPYIAELGALGAVARYWSVPVKHGQKAFRWYQDSFLLHLPADKHFLAAQAVRAEYDRAAFLGRYRAHLRKGFPLYLLKLLKQKSRTVLG
jgi:hypothetical protein